VKKAKILIVEDEQSLNEAYQMVLESEGYEIHAAYDGEQALKITEKIEPDLILLDLRMPKVGGIEFLKRYEASTKHPDVKIVIFSNLDTQKEIEEAYKLGAQKYILKAWASPKELVRLVEEILEK
jgi:two-component system, OmpR family, response regulator VicR